MNRIRIHSPIVLGAAAAGLIAQSVFAQAPAAGADVPQAELTLAQAVTIAEAIGNGRVTRVKLDDDDVPAWKLTVVAPGEAAQTFRIATQGGRILKRERDDRR